MQKHTNHKVNESPRNDFKSDTTVNTNNNTPYLKFTFFRHWIIFINSEKTLKLYKHVSNIYINTSSQHQGYGSLHLLAL